MDLATLLVPQNQVNSAQAAQGGESAKGSRGLDSSKQNQGITAFDQILQALSNSDHSQGMEHSAALSANGVASSSTGNTVDNAAANIAEMSLLIGQNFPTGVQFDVGAEGDPSFAGSNIGDLISAIQNFLEANPERIDDVVAFAQESGIDLSALDLSQIANAEASTTAANNTAEETSLLSKLGILNTVFIPEDDAMPAQAGTDTNNVTLSKDALSGETGDITTIDLTPEQMAVLERYLSGNAAQNETQSVDAIFEALLGLSENEQAQLLPPALQTALNNLTSQAQIVAPQAQNSGQGKIGNPPASGLPDELSVLFSSDPSSANTSEEAGDFETMIRQFSSGNRNSNDNGSGLDFAGMRDNAGIKGDAGIAARVNTINNGNPPIPAGGAGADALLTADSALLTSTSLSSADFAETQSAMLNNTSSLLTQTQTSLLAQANSATQSHPSTQMVAATLQKAGQGQQNTSITLYLDPADLGRVEVKMTFDHDHALKAVITAEKPETHMMMQRDSQFLERALQSAGMDTDVDLSFELAQDGSFFDNDDKSGGGHGHGGSSGNGDADDGQGLQVIESTMQWSVDPETGHTHYSILA